MTTTTISRELANKLAFIDSNNGVNNMNPKAATDTPVETFLYSSTPEEMEQYEADEAAASAFKANQAAVAYGVEQAESEFRTDGDDRPYEDIIVAEFADGDFPDAPVARPAKVAKIPGQAKVKVAKSNRPCVCGCGEMVAGYFKQGHDQRAKGMLIKATKANSPESVPESLKRWVLSDHAMAKKVTFDWAQYAPLFIPVMGVQSAPMPTFVLSSMEFDNANPSIFAENESENDESENDESENDESEDNE